MKDWAYLRNLDDYKLIENHWIGLYVNGDNLTHFNSFDVEPIPNETKFTGNKIITANIYRMQANTSIMCGYFCIGFINFMLKGKSWLEYINFFQQI